MGKLKVLMGLLIDGEPLPASYLDHPLKGEWRGFRDAHIEPDWPIMSTPRHVLAPTSFLVEDKFFKHMELK